MKFAYLGRTEHSLHALDYLFSQKIDLPVLVCAEKNSKLAEKWLKEASLIIKKYDSKPTKIFTNLEDFENEVYSENEPELYNQLRECDYGISYLYPKKIREPLLSSCKNGFINFHPGPLPQYRGVTTYTFAILNNEKFFGVSAHFVAESIDAGDVIEVIKFDIDSNQMTAKELHTIAQPKLFELFKKIVIKIMKGENLPKIVQKVEDANYYSYKDFEKNRVILESDDIDIIDRKIRAYWFPPWPGAYIKKNGEEFYLINKKILEKIND